jgi:phosphatidate cytidylyltransferase
MSALAPGEPKGTSELHQSRGIAGQFYDSASAHLRATCWPTLPISPHLPVGRIALISPMLRTRLWMGTILVSLGVLILIEGNWLAPWFPFLFVSASLALIFGAREFLLLLDPAIRPHPALCFSGVLAVILANWVAPLREAVSGFPSGLDAWHIVGAVFIAVLIAAFLWEIARFRGPDNITQRIGLTVLVVAYLGLLPSFLLQMRWLEGSVSGIPRSTMAIALTLFVPKCGDIGAFFTGKYLTGGLLGRNLMAPRLSPKKTWQGFVGGLLAAVAASVGLNSIAPVIPGGIAGAVGFGITVGLGGVLGDLAESLIKRDSQQKDASRTLPGFGGVLDVIDSLLFAAPVAYVWLA